MEDTKFDKFMIGLLKCVMIGTPSACLVVAIIGGVVYGLDSRIRKSYRTEIREKIANNDDFSFDREYRYIINSEDGESVKEIKLDVLTEEIETYKKITKQ